jgi:hypothetical protein
MTRTLGALVALLMASAAEAQSTPPPDQPASPPGPAPSVTAAVDSAATTVGGRVRLTLTVDAPEGWFVEPPAPAPELGAFRLRSVEPSVDDAGRRAFTLTLVPVEIGEREIPPITLRARRGSEDPIELASAPIGVSVASNLAPSEADSASAEPPKLADLKPALQAPRDWRPVWVAALAAIAAFAAAFALFRRLRRRPARTTAPVVERRAPARPAWEIALEDLDQVALDRWVDRGELRRQYEEVTEALRRYVENRWGIPALESTTFDLRRLLERTPVGPEIASRIVALLSEADLVKFAKAVPEPDAARASEKKARTIVLDTIPRDETKEEAA